MSKSPAAELSDAAYESFQAASAEILEIVKKFEVLRDAPETGEALRDKLHRAIEGLRNSPGQFYFARLLSPDLAPPFDMGIVGENMDGLNWPEELIPTIWAAQRASIARFKARKIMIAQLSKLLPEELNARSARHE